MLAAGLVCEFEFVGSPHLFLAAPPIAALLGLELSFDSFCFDLISNYLSMI